MARYVLPDGAMADIGTDHALLPVYLVQQGIVPKAVAGDIHQGPVQAAERQVRDAGLTDSISVRRGNGLEVLAPGEADTVTIAGMGGGTMADILNGGEEALAGVRRLVLQPNIGERIVREWLVQHGWKLTAEQLLEEDGVLYEVLSADAADAKEAEAWNRTLYTKSIPGYGELPKSVVLLMGPYLLERPTELFLQKWSRYSEKLDVLIEQIGRSEKAESERKRRQMEEEKQAVNEVLRWISK